MTYKERKMKMDDFEKMMEAEGAKPAKNDFKELVDFIADNQSDLWAIKNAIDTYSSKLRIESYTRGYEDAIELIENIMRKKIQEAANEIESLASVPF